jgi:glycosyltransferase involved in cell wall biosynthesis
MLTVLMPIAKIDDFLRQAIDSIKNQTYRNYTCHLLCNNMDSNDIKKLENFIASDDRYIIHQLSLGGIAFALNYGLNLCHTKYIARMDGDDLSHPTRFEKQIEFLENNPHHALVGCKVDLIDESGNKIIQEFKFYEGNIDIRRALKYRMPLCHPALMFSTKALVSSKGYLYGNTAEDHELYLRIAREPKYLFTNLREHLFSYRRHENQLTNISLAKTAYYNISGFLFTEFLISKNPIYLIGIFANHPLLRRARVLVRTLKAIMK